MTHCLLKGYSCYNILAYILFKYSYSFLVDNENCDKNAM